MMNRPTNILLAFDKFKGALTAEEACGIAASSLGSLGRDDFSLVEAPLTDGGEGFCPILAEANGGKIERIEVADPLWRSVRAPIGWVESGRLPEAARKRIGAKPGEKVAVIEMASASGLLLLDESERDPWHTTTAGTGELIRHAVVSGADRIVLGVGGSATNDCGAGVLEALGVEFLAVDGQLITQVCPARFDKVDRVDFSRAMELPPLIIASDVRSPLLGKSGATRVFGPQKGLKDVERMEDMFTQLSIKVSAASTRDPSADDPGMGAAGGISFGLSSLAAVRIEPGFSLVSEWMGLEDKISAADWVLTGEGRVDQGSLSGKGPISLVREAAAQGVQTRIFAGALEAGVPESLSAELGDSCKCIALSDPNWSLATALDMNRSRLEEEVIHWARAEL